MEAPSQPKSLVELMLEKCSLEDTIQYRQAEYEKAQAQTKQKLNLCLQQIELHKASLDIERIKRAREVIYIGDVSMLGSEGSSCIEDAKEFLIRGCLRYENGEINHYKNLFTHYYGAKNYDGWVGQRSDHTYGYGPKHGHIVFMIGLSPSVREAKELTYEQKEDALYYLLNCFEVHNAEFKAALQANRNQSVKL